MLKTKKINDNTAILILEVQKIFLKLWSYLKSISNRLWLKKYTKNSYFEIE